MVSENELINYKQFSEYKTDGDVIEGATYDFRLGAVLLPDPNSDIIPFFGFDDDGNEVRRLPPLVEVPPARGKIYRFYDGGTYIIQSLETFKFPPTVQVGGLVASKSSYFVALSETSGTFISMGFDGKLKAKFRCDFRPYIEVALGYRIGCVKFFLHTPGKMDVYDGIWKGDKITTNGKFERGY
jgi:deoxycytidine triphosphate deaminase